MPEPRRILVFQTAYMGDVVLTTPLFDALAAQFPNAEIDIVTQPAWAPLVRHHRAVRETIGFDKRGAQRGVGALFAFARGLGDRGYDLALCPHPSLRSALALRLARIPRRVGFHDSAGAFLFTDRVRRDTMLHETARVLSLLGAIGDAPAEPATPRVYLPTDLDVDALLTRCGLDPKGRYAGLHPGSVWATKRWLPERFVEVGRALASEFDRVLVFGGPGEKELAARVAGDIGGAAVDLAGKLSVIEMAALLSRLALYVTNDSGPMHVAASFGTPVVAVFGSTVPAQGYAPVGPRCRVVEIALSCRPCGPHGHVACPLGHFRCMTDLTSDAVVAACRDVMA